MECTLQYSMTGKQYATSRWLSYLLRYGSADNGIWLDSDGWADVRQVADLRCLKPADIVGAVTRDPECRFELLFQCGWWVRAAPPLVMRDPWTKQSSIPPPPGLGPPGLNAHAQEYFPPPWVQLSGLSDPWSQSN